jgi:hypothetical protein
VSFGYSSPPDFSPSYPCVSNGYILFPKSVSARNNNPLLIFPCRRKVTVKTDTCLLGITLAHVDCCWLAELDWRPSWLPPFPEIFGIHGIFLEQSRRSDFADCSSFGYGWIFGRENRNSDFAGDNRTQEFQYPATCLHFNHESKA